MLNTRKDTAILLLGDIVCFYLALLMTLFLRYQAIPTDGLLVAHLVPFSILFAVWLVVYFIAGLYERHATFMRERLSSLILNALVANSVIAVLFFYFIPVFRITPKTNLFIDLALTLLLVLFWRKRVEAKLRPRELESALLVASGEEMRELEAEINRNPRYGLKFAAAIDVDAVPPHGLKNEVISKAREHAVKVVVADLNSDKLSPALPSLYNLLFSNVRLVQMHELYEDIFLRVPLSLVGHSWFLENVSTAPKRVYDGLKRVMDVVLGAVLLVLSLPFDIVAYIAIKLDDGGPAFIVQERLGKNDKRIRIYKFRTMTTNDDGRYGDEKARENKVTRVGSFLRTSRIDEFPQFWNVIAGSLSLVGPRPELPSLAVAYDEKVPFYQVRHILKPGLSGWAQIYHENHPHHGEAVEETREKLSYDLYYVKNRSLLLDLKIALRTVQTLLSRTGK